MCESTNLLPGAVKPNLRSATIAIMSAVTVAASNIEEGVERLAQKAPRRPILTFFLGTFALVVLVAGGGPLLNLLDVYRTHAPLSTTASVSSLHAASTQQQREEEPITDDEVRSLLRPKASKQYDWAKTPLVAPPPSPPPPPPTIHAVHKELVQAQSSAPTCGDGKCESPETITSCFADCPGVTTPPICGEEPHSDPQGNAVVDGRGHHVKDAGECCAACQAHAAKHPKNRPCNSWVFCYMPHCWSADNGNTHLFGECWLKWQTDPVHPLYGQRGRYTDDFRRVNRDKHLNGFYPSEKDKASVEAMRPFGIIPGSRRNLTVPTHVSWTGGVIGAKVDLSVQWTTGADGTMKSSAGDVVVDYRPWESREQNLKRGVKPEQMKF